MTINVAALQPLRVQGFALFWSAQALSRLGDPITLIALAAISYSATGSALFTAVAVLVTMLPSAIFGFAAGAVSDALGHRRAMVICDLARVAFIGAIPIALANGLPLWTALVLAFVAGMFAAIFNPARVALIPLLVMPGELGTANGLVSATDRTVEIVGALLGGILVATLGANALYVDALTFALSAVLLARIQMFEPTPGRISWRSVWSEAAEGLAFIGGSALLRANTVFSLAAQLSLPVYNGLLPVLIFRRFAAGDPELGARQFGIAEGVYAFGAVLAAIALPPYMRRVPKGRLLLIGFTGFGLALVLIGAAPSFAALVALVFAAGSLNMVFFVPNVTIGQENTPPHLRGRVFGARTALVALTWLPIVLVTGKLADQLDAGALIAAAGVLTTLIAIGATRVRVLRETP
jgi:MFS family permease